MVSNENELIKKKYDKLVVNTIGLSNRVNNAEKRAKTAENKVTAVEEKLRVSQQELDSDVTEYKNRLQKEYENKSSGLQKENKKMRDAVDDSMKIADQLRTMLSNITHDLNEMTKNVKSTENELTTLNNKSNTIVGKVASARNRIRSLNASTPYRPGAVERTLMDVLEDLKNV